MITESQIKAALRNAPRSKQRLELRDDGERGTGRLVLIVRVLSERITSEWYAVYYRSGKRASVKIGSYPMLALADARKLFREQFAPVISAGGEPVGKRSRALATTHDDSVKGLFQAYVDSLRASGKRSAYLVECLLLTGKRSAVKVIGASKRASQIEAEDIVPYLAEIYGRGSATQAKTARAYVSAAFAWGMKAAHDYKRRATGSNWNIKHNPVAAIPADNEAENPGDRFLEPREVRLFWRWLETQDQSLKGAIPARLKLATGQRTEEILRISVTAYEADKQLVAWDKTKNRLPHSIPLPDQAVAIFSGLGHNTHGWYFAHREQPDRPARYNCVAYAIRAFLEEHTEIDPFTARDLRRTWKTLAGDAGISKDMRDRLQNHAKTSDVSSKHYDRYDYLPERRAAMARWSVYLDLVLDGKITAVGQPTTQPLIMAAMAARESNVVVLQTAGAADDQIGNGFAAYGR